MSDHDPARGGATGAADAPRIRRQMPARRAADGVAGAGPAIDGVALLTIDRPAVRNALDAATIEELIAALQDLDRDPECRCLVLTGSGDRAFAAGADIREMLPETPVSLTLSDRFGRWDEIARVRTPIIAAVRGYALGGGCELAMACDMIVAAEDAVFGQPEIRLGIIPGAGGTQRLTRALGKALAMEMILTGRNLPATEAAAHGLVSQLVPSEGTLEAALDLAERIAAMPPLAVTAAKEAVNRAQELPLREGVAAERRLFYSLFATDDQKEGMQAFLEKRPARWRGR